MEKTTKQKNIQNISSACIFVYFCFFRKCIFPVKYKKLPWCLFCLLNERHICKNDLKWNHAHYWLVYLYVDSTLTFLWFPFRYVTVNNIIYVLIHTYLHNNFFNQIISSLLSSILRALLDDQFLSNFSPETENIWKSFQRAISRLLTADIFFSDRFSLQKPFWHREYNVIIVNASFLFGNSRYLWAV